MNNENSPRPETYLGDGVYASYDGYHIWLNLRGQDDTTRIALEPPVLRGLVEFSERVTAEPPLAVDPSASPAR